ncbi:lachesin-like [Trichogramma pretiosum]|uniref:lachesin-like n=1 Tax=Trichogramma pretiosum TaxID=7493 RepID=UPI0006C9BE4C|nr:lachesin-like [Trichogramma pretiosum]
MASHEFAATSLLLATLLLLQLCLCQIAPEIMPEFLAPLENHTVIQGREVSFTCVVNHLQSYRVAWIKSDSRAILAIHTHLVAHNPRLSVTHNGHNTWKLHVSNVQKNDSGTYMCQVNTEPMLSQMGYMTVVIPPDIMDETSEGLVAHEGGNIKLRCVATGSPEPNVTWKREDGHKIVLRENGQKKLLEKYEGEQLELTGVLRQEMGTYLCIASNGIPPTVSKRYAVNVQFQPSIKVTNHVVGAPVTKNVTLQCIVEASPQAMNTWFTDKGEKLLPNDKYSMSEAPINHYSWEMNLTIRSLDKGDFVGYVCSSENALGKAEGAVRLQELELVRDVYQTTSAPGTQSRPNDLRPNRKKQQQQGSKSSRRKFSQRHHDSGGGGDDDDNQGGLGGGGEYDGSHGQGHDNELLTSSNSGNSLGHSSTQTMDGGGGSGGKNGHQRVGGSAGSGNQQQQHRNYDKPRSSSYPGSGSIGIMLRATTSLGSLQMLAMIGIVSRIL